MHINSYIFFFFPFGPLIYFIEKEQNQSLMFSYLLQPGHYLGHLIGHEGKGSLLSELKQKGKSNFPFLNPLQCSDNF